MSTHRYAHCLQCGWHVESPSDAEQERHRKMPGHVVVSRMHPRSLCATECQTQTHRMSAEWTCDQCGGHTLRIVSLFSGVGGIDLGFEAAGATTVLLCEYDKNARAILARRFPGVPIHHDIRELTADDLRAAGACPGCTVCVAGFPCQDVSIAGARKGMGGGTRSGLYWHVDRILGEFRPAWIVLENVPGLLSAACACRGDESCIRAGRQERCGAKIKGEWQDHITHSVAGGGACVGGCIPVHGGVMGAVLGSVADRGYGFAYRVLDAKFFGVPQRRRRVVIVGRLGDTGAAPAQVLLEPEGGLGDLAQGDPTWARPADALGFGVGVAGERGVVANTLTARDAQGPLPDQSLGTVVMSEGTTAPCLTAEYGEQSGQDGLAHATAGSLPVHEIVSTLQAGGGDRGYRIDAEAARGGGISSSAHRRTVGALTSNGVGICGADDNQAQAGHLIAVEREGEREGERELPRTFQKIVRSGARDVNGDLPPEVRAERDVAATLNLHDLGSDTRAVEIVVQPLVTTILGDHTHTLTAAGRDASEDGTGRGTPIIAVTLAAGTSRPGANPPSRRQEDDENIVAFHLTQNPVSSPDLVPALGARSGGNGIHTETAVRRLTPLECERLQGFPDDWTKDTDDGPQADTHRYKQMGNAVAVPVFAWVARRLVAVNQKERS